MFDNLSILETQNTRDLASSTSFFDYGDAHLTLFIRLKDENVKSYGESELSP